MARLKRALRVKKGRKENKIKRKIRYWKKINSLDCVLSLRNFFHESTKTLLMILALLMLFVRKTKEKGKPFMFNKEKNFPRFPFSLRFFLWLSSFNYRRIQHGIKMILIHQMSFQISFTSNSNFRWISGRSLINYSLSFKKGNFLKWINYFFHRWSRQNKSFL